MKEHYTKSTISVSAFCFKCQKSTEHRVDHGCRGPCMRCIERLQTEYTLRELDKRRAERQAALWGGFDVSIDEFPKEVLDALERDGGIRIKPRGDRRRDEDSRFCYGARCTWFGSIYEVGSTKPHSGDVGCSLPCCPLCGSVLFEMPTEAEWWKGIDDFERGEYPLPTAHKHPGYRAMWEWQRENKLCFSDFSALAQAYEAMTGNHVDVAR